MSATKSIHPDEKYKADKIGRSLFKVGLGVGLALGALSVILGMSGSGWRRFLFAYLVGWAFILSICVGALFFIMSHHIARAKWGIVLRRLAEMITGAFPAVFVLGLGFMIPVLAGNEKLYFWSTKVIHNADHPLYHHLHNKFGWLSPGVFFIRYLVYAAFYIGVSAWFRRTSARMDRATDAAEAAALANKMRVASGPGILAFALVTVFVGFDLFMSLSPTWYSTIYSVNYFSGSMLALYCTLAIAARMIQRTGHLTHSVSIEHYHDIGKYMFGWTFFWIYTAFSQYMLQWYGNIPEETVWYSYRLYNDWLYVSIAVLVGHWLIPYVALVTRWTKRILPLLMALAVWQLVFHWIDLYWNIMPNIEWGPGGVAGPLTGDPAAYKIGFSPVDITVSLALIGLLCAAVGRSMRGNLIPVKDPKLGECLAFENY